MNKLLIPLLIILIHSAAIGQKKDAYKILESVKAKLNSVKDYEADIKIKVDFNFLKVPDMTAKIYFKEPDKVKLDSKEFAMLPKQALTFSPRKLLEFDYSALYINSQVINGSQTDVIKIIPNSDTVEIAVSSLWIDPVNSVVKKVESTLKKGGTFQFDIDYSSQIKFGLPSAIKFTVDLSSMQGPRQMKSDGTKDTGNNKKSGKGTVNIFYNNYKVNKGIPDSFFKENPPKK